MLIFAKRGLKSQGDNLRIFFTFIVLSQCLRKHLKRGRQEDTSRAVLNIFYIRFSLRSTLPLHSPPPNCCFQRFCRLTLHILRSQLTVKLQTEREDQAVNENL